MFKELKYIKITFAILLLGFVVYQSKSKYKFTQIVLKPTSFVANESISFAVPSNVVDNNYALNIRNLTNDGNSYDTVLSLKKTFDYFDNSRPIVEGYTNSTNLFSLSPVNKSGIYLCNNVFPFIVNSKQNSDITVVCPIVNNHFYKESKGERIFEIEESEISLNRPVEIDDWTLGLKPFFSKLESKYKVNYATDLDLEDYSFFEKTRVVFLYGRIKFWSPKMMRNIQRYINSGGKILMASSDIFYAKFCYNSIDNRLSVLNCKNTSFSKKMESWKRGKKDSTFLYFNLHSDYGGESINKNGYKIIELKHPIFKQINTEETLAFEGEQFLGTPIKTVNPIKVYFNTQIKILAYTECKETYGTPKIGGIIEYNNINGGRIISLGSSDLCLPKNQKKEEIKKLFSNATEYLLAN